MQNSHRRFQIGPGAASLIMMIVVLSMSALGILALVNARNDLQLSYRSAEVAEEIYTLNEQAVEQLAALDTIFHAQKANAADDAAYLEAVAAALPEDVTMEGNIISWQESTEGDRVLHCAVQLHPLSDSVRYSWVKHRLAIESEEMEFDDLWN